MSGADDRGAGWGAALGVALLGLAVGWFVGGGRPGVAPAPGGLDERMASALETIDPIERSERLLGVLAEFGPESLEKILAGLDEKRRRAGECDVRPFVSAWAGFDPEAAFAEAITWPTTVRRTWGASEVVYQLGLDGRFDDAQGLIDKLSLPRVAGPTQAAFIEGWVRSGHLDEATEFLLGLTDDTYGTRALEGIIVVLLLEKGPEGVIEWVESIREDTSGDRTKRQIFNLASRWIASLDPERARDWYEKHRDADYAQRAPLGIAEEWVEHDGPAALEWAFAEPRVSQQLLTRRVIRRFTAKDPEAAARWVASRPSFEGFEDSFAILADGLEERDPGAALGWALRMEQEEARERLITRVTARWLTSDEEAARSWLAANELPEPLVQKIESQRLAILEGSDPWL